MKKREKRTEVTQDYVITKLREISEKDASDGPDSDLKYSSKIKALELLGKHVGAFDGSTKNDKNEPVKVIIDV